MAGNAAREAALKIREKLVHAAQDITGYAAEGFVLENEEIIYTRDPRVRVTFMQALEKALANNGALIAKGKYMGPPPVGGKFKGARAGLSPSYSFQCYIAEVSVDTETFEPRVEKVWAAHDCGKALNPLAVQGQIEGCIHMGLGQAMMEEMVYNRGNVLSANFLDYRTLTPMQMPEVDVIIVESDDPEGPWGAKEAGEGPLLPILPAVANAIYDAVGVRLRSLPMTADKIWKAMQDKTKIAKRRTRAIVV
ncbi:MAG: hypothetical protein DYG95_29045 [Chlorobi bacterium CHB1]|nr:hypothetical protein [Chlorobi bacterium CHB1]